MLYETFKFFLEWQFETRTAFVRCEIFCAVFLSTGLGHT